MTLQRVALLLTHAHLRCIILAGKRWASVDASVMGMVNFTATLYRARDQVVHGGARVTLRFVMMRNSSHSTADPQS
jgi:TPP-dependent pyruvate/acetoin dehydrogenase alpha subunit